MLKGHAHGHDAGTDTAAVRYLIADHSPGCRMNRKSNGRAVGMNKDGGAGARPVERRKTKLQNEVQDNISRRIRYA